MKKRIFIPGLVMATVAVMVNATSTLAAQYQMMFNNVEQGAGSHAAPQLNVGDGTRKNLAKRDLPDESQSPAETSNPNSTLETQVIKEDFTLASTRPKKYFRLGLLAAAVNESHEIISGANAQKLASSSNSVSGELMLGFFPLESLGLNLFMQSNTINQPVLGAEIEVLPVHAQIFDLENFLEWGFLAGFSTQGRRELKNLGISDGLAPAGTVHLGTRLGLNFGNTFSVSGGIRLNVTSRSSYDYLTGDVGLLVHL